MKLVHSVKLSVFSRSNEDSVEDKKKIKKVLESLVSSASLNLKKEKISTEHTQAAGLQENIITIFTIILTKQSHTNKFLEYLFQNLGKTQKNFIQETLESRLDSELDFFMRLDKPDLVNNNKFTLTDSGNCFHIRLTIAAFPKKRPVAIETIKKILDKY